jgi:hypothetical protein
MPVGAVPATAACGFWLLLELAERAALLDVLSDAISAADRDFRCSVPVAACCASTRPPPRASRRAPTPLREPEAVEAPSASACPLPCTLLWLVRAPAATATPKPVAEAFPAAANPEAAASVRLPSAALSASLKPCPPTPSLPAPSCASSDCQPVRKLSAAETEVPGRVAPDAPALPAPCATAASVPWPDAGLPLVPISIPRAAVMPRGEAAGVPKEREAG